jgi:hypothetical protein
MTPQDEARQLLENWRAARIAFLAAQYTAKMITQKEFLHDVRQAMQGDR